MRNRRNISIFFILSLFLTNCSHGVDKKSIEYSKQSDTLLGNGNLKEAEVAIRKALDLDDKNYVAYNNLGILNIKLGRSEDKVLEALLKSVSIKSDYLVGLYNIANYYFEIKKYSNSIEYCTRYIEISNNENNLNYSIGHIYALRGECRNYLMHYSDAISDLNFAITRNSNDAGVFKELGSSFRNLGRYKEAIENYSKAIEININYAQAYDGLGICYDNGLKDYNKALENYNKAIELEPQSGTYLYNRGAFLFDNGFKERVYRDLIKADSLGKTEAREYITKYNN